MLKKRQNPKKKFELYLDFSERDEQAFLDLGIEAQEPDGLLEIAIGGS